MFKMNLLIAGIILLVSGYVQAASTASGAALYQQHCQHCHGQQGLATMAGAPDFKRGQGLFKSDFELLAHLQQGRNACPSFMGVMREDDMYDVIAYIRTLFP